MGLNLFDSSKLRVTFIADEPWWVIVDVFALLSSTTSITKSKHWFKEGETIVITCLKGSITFADYVTGKPVNIMNSERVVDDVFRLGTNKIILVNESGLYRMTSRVRSPLAKSFRDWVDSELLPSYRKKISERVGTAPTAPTAPTPPETKKLAGVSSTQEQFNDIERYWDLMVKVHSCDLPGISSKEKVIATAWLASVARNCPGFGAAAASVPGDHLLELEAEYKKERVGKY